MKKVTIELTSEQRDKIRSETGADVKSFTYEALENRDAPKKFIGGDLGDEPLEPGGGKPMKPGP
jgi:hypothetical protein